MSKAKPFKDIETPIRNKIATRKWVRRFLLLILRKFHLTGEGVDLIETGNGHLHLRVLQDESQLSHPFKVTMKDGFATIKPGLVYSANFEVVNGVAAIQHMPVIGTTRLDATPAPVLGVGTNGVRYICLTARFAADGVGYLPWRIEAFSSAPADQPVVRIGSNTTAQPQEGIYHVLIATVKDGQVQQFARNNILVNLLWNDVLVWS